MSVVFTCECGRRTTEPYIIRNVKMCVICADEIRPEVVDSRERYYQKRYGTQLKHSPGFEGASFDHGKRTSR